MSFLYTKAYDSKNYQQGIIKHVESKKEQYEKLLGVEEYSLIHRYAHSKFDDNLHVEDFQSFQEDQLIIFNNYNWLMATRKHSSPLHSLFFKEGVKIDGI